jgi:hypothetical protein
MAIRVANNQSLTAITALPSGVSGGAMTLLETQTASSSSTISFTSGIDSTYDEYIFTFINAHPETNDVALVFNLSIDGGSNYNVTKTTTAFRAIHDEADSSTALEYRTSQDLAQSTAFQQLGGSGNDNDQAISGTLRLFNPSSTTFVKHFIATNNACDEGDGSRNNFVSGYANTTSAVNAVQFKFASDAIDAGTFKLYGVS